jgi:MFS family permease
MLSGMQQPSFPTRPTRPIGRGAAAAVIAGAAMGAVAGARVACLLASVLPGPGGCVPGGAPAGALVGALLALVALPLLGQGTRRGEPAAAHRPAPSTTTAARLVWLAIAAALARWLAEAPLHPQMGLEGVGWLALLPVVLVAGGGLAVAAEGLLRRRGWARWAAVVAFSLAGVSALAGLADWIGALVRSRASGLGPLPIDLVTSVLFLAVSVGVIVLLMTPATRRDFRSSSRPRAATNSSGLQVRDLD